MTTSNHSRSNPRAAGSVLTTFVALSLTVWLTQTPAQNRTPAVPRALHIDGLTLDEWRDRMGRLDLQDPGSASAVPGLIALVRSEDVPWFTRRQAALTLGRLGPIARVAVPVLIDLVHVADGDPETAPQLWAITALGLFGSVAREATPELVAVLNDDAAGLPSRLSAIDALSQTGIGHPVAIAALIARIQRFPETTVDRELRRTAVEALGMMGPSASPAVPALARLLNDPEETVRREAATALGRLGSLSEPALELLAERLATDDSPAVQDAVATAIGRMDSSRAGEWVSSLVTADDPHVRQRALQIFATWGPKARAWLPLVQSLWCDPTPAVRLAALDAAWRLDGRGETIAPRVAELVGSDDRTVRRNAVALLERLGTTADLARPALQTLLQDRRVEVRTAARKALEAINRGSASQEH